jgi:putative chitinase
MDFKKFFDALRPHINLTDSNVDGLQRIAVYADQTGTQINDAAYCMGTAFWETGQSCQPVEEGFYLGSAAKVKAFQRKLRYYPWFGRGLIQTTWEGNYVKVAKLLGLPDNTFTKNPDLLLEWEYALPALFEAMEAGIYTGKDLDDYIDDLDEPDDEDRREYTNARRIVNGTDKAAKIADLAIHFEHALKAAGYGTKPLPAPAPVIVAPEPEAPPVKAPAPDSVPAPLSFWQRLIIFIRHLFGAS